MDLETALQMVWDRSLRSSQRRVAKEMGVEASAVTRWKKGEEPQGRLRELLFAWAERHAAAPAPDPGVVPAAVIQHARRQVAETHRDLSRIYGYAESIADLAEQVATKQRGLLTMLSPWVGTETDVKSGAIGDVLGLLEKMDAGEIPTPSAPADAAPAVRKGRRKSAG